MQVTVIVLIACFLKVALNNVVCLSAGRRLSSLDIFRRSK